MNYHPTGARFRKKLGIVAFTLVLIHILICVLVIILPSSLAHSNFLTSAYRSLMVVGPFFYEARIKSSTHLEIAVFSNGAWSTIEEGRMANFREYQRMPWRFDLLHRNDFEEYAVYQIASLKKRDFETIKSTKAFRELNQFVLGQYVYSAVDSISLKHFIKVYLPATDSFRYDSIFAYTYSPHEIAPASAP